MKGVLIQFYSAFVVSLGSFFAGYGVAWPSYTIPLLQSNSTPLGVVISPYESSLIGSSSMIGSCIATFFGAYLCDTLGRKKTYLLSLLFHVLNWTLVGTAKTVTQIIVGRLSLGIAMSLQIVVGLVFTSELSQMSLRGPLISLVTLLYTLGVMASYINGWVFSYEVINYLTLSATVVTVVLASFLKESPAFLVLQGKDEEALKCLKFYRGTSQRTKEVLEELAALQKQKHGGVDESSPENEKLNPNVKQCYTEDTNAWKLLLTSPPLRRALLTSVSFFFLLVSCGTVAINVYAGKLFRSAVPDLSPDLCSVLLAGAVVAGSGVAVVCTDMIGRRVLMISTGVLSSTCLLLLATVLRWRWAGQWAVPALVLVYCCVFQLGVANIPFVQMAESFPSKVKSQVNTIVGLAMWAANFVVLALFEPSIQYIGISGTILSYAVMSVITTITAALIMKETRRVPLEEILEMYSKGFLYKAKR